MLDLLEPWDRSPVEEEEVAAGPGVLDGVLDEVDDGVAFELGEAAKAEVAWNIFFDKVSFGKKKLPLK